MSRQLMNAPIGMDVDHIDGNTLNNSRSNLRVCTRQENMLNKVKYKSNTSGYKGVCRNKYGKRWIAQITVRGIHTWLGTFDSKEQAAIAYISFANNSHPEFVR